MQEQFNRLARKLTTDHVEWHPELASLPLADLKSTKDYCAVAMSDDAYAEYDKFGNIIAIKIVREESQDDYYIIIGDDIMTLFPFNYAKPVRFETNADTIGELCLWFIDNPDAGNEEKSVFADRKSLWQRKKALH